jgi:hypothetical protein
LTCFLLFLRGVTDFHAFCSSQFRWQRFDVVFVNAILRNVLACHLTSLPRSRINDRQTMGRKNCVPLVESGPSSLSGEERGSSQLFFFFCNDTKRTKKWHRKRDTDLGSSDNEACEGSAHARSPITNPVSSASTRQDGLSLDQHNGPTCMLSDISAMSAFFFTRWHTR